MEPHAKVDHRFCIRGALGTDGAACETFTTSRSASRNELPQVRICCSSLAVQSHSQHAHGSSPVSSRQCLRLCASWTRSNSKNCSQYGRSSCNGSAQKHTSTHRAVP